MVSIVAYQAIASTCVSLELFLHRFGLPGDGFYIVSAKTKLVYMVVARQAPYFYMVLAYQDMAFELFTVKPICSSLVLFTISLLLHDLAYDVMVSTSCSLKTSVFLWLWFTRSLFRYGFGLPGIGSFTVLAETKCL